MGDATARRPAGNGVTQTRLGVLAAHLRGDRAVLRATPARARWHALAPAPTAAAALQLGVVPGPMMSGQVAVITGAGQGIGAAAARLFAQHGAMVVVSDLDDARGRSVAAEIVAAGGRAISHSGDATADGFPEALVAAAVAAFGRIDVLVPNAGYTWDAVIHKTSREQWDAMLDVHCTGPFRLIQAAAPHMRDAGKREMEGGGAASPRSILLVSSVSGVHGSAGQANYATAKAGVVGLAKTVAKEWGRFNVRCNALVYGMIATRLVAAKEDGATIRVGGREVALGIPGAGAGAGAGAGGALGRAGTPEEAAGAMLLLASPLASYITGQAVEVTGGSHL